MFEEFQMQMRPHNKLNKIYTVSPAARCAFSRFLDLDMIKLDMCGKSQLSHDKIITFSEFLFYFDFLFCHFNLFNAIGFNNDYTVEQLVILIMLPFHMVSLL